MDVVVVDVVVIDVVVVVIIIVDCSAARAGVMQMLTVGLGWAAEAAATR